MDSRLLRQLCCSAGVSFPPIWPSFGVLRMRNRRYGRRAADHYDRASRRSPGVDSPGVLF